MAHRRARATWISRSLGVGAAAAALLVAPTAAITASQAATTDRFAYSAAGWGVRVNGGELPVDSESTSFQVIGCTNNPGTTRHNEVAEAILPGIGVVRGVTTTLRTGRDGEQRFSRGVHEIAELVIGDAESGSITLRGITTRARAWWDGDRFRASVRTHVASAEGVPPGGGEPQQLEVPTPEQPLEVPGLATIAVGNSTREVTSTFAKAAANGLRVDVVPSGTRATVAHSQAQLTRGVKNGLFHGRSNATRARGLQDNVHSGPQPLQVMPCLGTDGVVERRAIAALDFGQGAQVMGLATRQKGDQDGSKARGFTEGSVLTARFGDGRVVVEGIVGRANVVREGGDVRRNAKGTELGSLTIDGEPRTFPPSDVIEVPGVVRLERRIIDRSPTGISVTSLRATLLDGSGAVIDLGQARLRIDR